METIVSNTPRVLQTAVFARGPNNARHAFGYLSGHLPLPCLQQKRSLSIVSGGKTFGGGLHQAQRAPYHPNQTMTQVNIHDGEKKMEQNVLDSTALCPQRKKMKSMTSGKVALGKQSFPSFTTSIQKGHKLNPSPTQSAIFGRKVIKCNSMKCDDTSYTPSKESSEGVCLNSDQKRAPFSDYGNSFQRNGNDNEEKENTRISFSDTFTARVVNQPFAKVGWRPKGERSPSDLSLHDYQATLPQPLPKREVSHGHLQGRRERSRLVLLEPDECIDTSRGVGCADPLTTQQPSFRPRKALCTEEDDVVLDTPKALLSMFESPDSAKAFGDVPQTLSVSDGPDHSGGQIQETESNPYYSPAARGIGQDVIDLVTDAFAEQRDALIKKRRQVLYDMTHPCASDYTYGNKLVPPPPLSFGKVTEEAVRLGNELLLGQKYFLVNKAGVKANVAASLGMSETKLHDPTKQNTGKSVHVATTARSPYRGRAREGNIFRDHNYFFEINELYQEIVLVGKACAGKSSLLNALLGQSVAKTSSTPNTTREISFYQSVTPEELQAFHASNHHNLVKLPGAGLQLTFVDIPGFGIEGMSDKWRDAAIELTDAYFGVRRSVNTVIFCIDCDRGLTKTDLKYFQWLENVQGVFFPVLTKCDSVPHSRICSVMRQIYTLITEKRRKYRKVFPFVIPTSSKEGTNIEMLRGLITETSGMIPGDRLRELLQQKQAGLMKEALVQESMRLGEAHQLQREQAREQFKLSNTGQLRRSNPPLAPSLPPQSNEGKFNRGSLGVETDCNESRFYRLSIRKKDSIPVVNQFSSSSHGEEDVTTQVQQGEEYRHRGEGSLTQRRTNPIIKKSTPYGKVRFRLHSGIDDLDSETIDLRYETPHREHPEAPMLSVEEGKGRMRMEGIPDAAPENSTPANSPLSFANHPYSPPSAAAPPRSLLAPEPSCVVGWPPAPIAPSPEVLPKSRGPQTGTDISSPTAAPASQKRLGGPISHFLDMMEQFSTHKKIAPVNCPSSKKKKLCDKEKRWIKQKNQGYVPSLMVQDENGRLSEFKAGKRFGPTLVNLDTEVDSRQAEWRSKQLKDLLHQHSSESPWRAVSKIVQSIETEKQRSFMKGMRPKDLAAYLRNAGGVTKSFEKFEGEVTASKYMNEVRQARTLRSREQMHLNATAKINWRSMPPGLWKQYGKKDTYWPTTSVLGRENDESHATSYSTPTR